MKKDNKLIISLGINILIIMLELIGFFIVTRNLKFQTFIYYTQDSNLLLLISSMIYSYYLILQLQGKKVKIPKWFTILRFTATLSVLVTFVVVLTVLTPMFSNGLVGAFLEGSMLYHHLLCPLLGVGSFIFIEGYKLDKKDAFKSLYFTIAYAIVFIFLNTFNIVDGPYPFLRVHEQSIFISMLWVILIHGGAYLSSLLLIFLNKKYCLEK